MNNKKISKKLVLSKTTISRLNDSEMNNAAIGGATLGPICMENSLYPIRCDKPSVIPHCDSWYC